MGRSEQQVSSSCFRRFLKALVLLALLAGIGLVTSYYFRTQLLTGLANAWTVNDPLVKADAILVMGGGLQYRTAEAARLYKEGLAPRILVANAKPSPTDRLGITTREKEVMKQILTKLGVPETAVSEVGDNVRSSYQEAVAMREWMRTNHAQRVIVPTDIFHTRRAKWLFKKQFEMNGGQVIIDAITPEEYSATDWWQHDEGLMAFFNELIKFPLYAWKYR